jgi:glutathione S-transferase
MKLYYNPLSTYSQKTMLAFYEKGIAYTPEFVDLASADGQAAYEKVNPLGKVPFLLAGDGWQVPESTSIIEYLEEEFPDTPRLIPATGRGSARQVRFMDRMADLYFNEPIIELLFQQIGFRPHDAERAKRSRKYVEVTYAHWNRRLAGQPWLCGASLTMADCAAIPALFYAQIVAPFTNQPNVVAYWQRAQERPSYARIRAEFEPIWKGMMAQQRSA